MMWQPGITLAEIERHVILMALRFYQGNRTRTADALDIAPRTLTNKIGEYKKEGFEVTPAAEPTFKRTIQEEAKVG